MILGTAKSPNNVSIRLTEERWIHIITSHCEISPTEYSRVLNTIKNPDALLEGDFGEILAIRKISGKKQWLVVVYKETNKKDGFVITAYITTDYEWLLKRRILWSKKS